MEERAIGHPHDLVSVASSSSNHMNHMRFNRKNWEKFFDGSNKKTTIRLKKRKEGHYQADTGSYYHPIKLGEFYITKVTETTFGALNHQDAVDDGFKSLNDLIAELEIINGKIHNSTILWKHWIENVR